MTFRRETLEEIRGRRVAEKEAHLRELAIRPARALARGVYAPVDQSVAAVPKEDAPQHEGYMRLVRQLPCARCGRPGPSEFCHSDMGKGTSIKSDCREGWPGCKYRSPEDPGCHWLVGTKRIYDKEARRQIEADMAARTRAKIIAAGDWPKNLQLLD